jgi:hypothetical protein
MRIRSTKPEFWRSERIASVSWDARLVLKGLESYVDDNGVGKDDLALIVGDVFSRDMLASPRETVARVSEAISELHQAGLLWRYDADGTALLYISWWEDIQRIDKPGAGRLRRPDGTLAYKESTIRESVASPRESVAPGTGEQGNRGTGEQGRKAGAARSRATRIPDSWTPNSDHQTRALRDGLDLDTEATKFRAYAEEKDRAVANWNAAFTRWLIQASEYAIRDRTRPSTASRTRVDENLAVARQIAQRDGIDQPAREIEA